MTAQASGVETKAAEPVHPTARRRVLVAPAVLLGVLVGITLFLAGNHLVTVRESRAWEQHSHAVIETTQAVFSQLQEAESAQRGFLAYGDPRFLDTFDARRTALSMTVVRLAALVGNNPEQAARVNRATMLVNERLAIAASRVALARQGRVEEARRVIPGSKQASDRARAAISDLMANETALLVKRTAAADQAERTSFIIALILGAVAVVGLSALVFSMASTNRALASEVGKRERAQAAQRESEALYSAFFANTADYLYVIDVSVDGVFRVAELNPAFERATGITTAAARGRTLQEVWPGRRGDALVAHYRRVVAEGKPVPVRHVVRTPGGERTWESITVPVHDQQGRVERAIGSSRDVTDREHAEERLRQSHRMEAVGQLTGGIAHDFNNLLQVVRGNLELLDPLVAGNERAIQRVKNARHAANRAAQLTRQLLAFARRQPLEPNVINLGQIVKDMGDMLQRTLGEAIEIETEIAAGLWNTIADAAQVESAILNLAINARDAMPDGGRLNIEITNMFLNESDATGDPDVTPGQYVQLAVTDTGQGMSADTLARAFEPFFSTKAEDKGTGLGLSMVYGFVKQSSGHIQIHSEVGKGTTVKIYLPSARQAVAALATTGLSAPVGEGPSDPRKVVLVVEDDTLVRMAAADMIAALGFIVLQAEAAPGALTVLRGPGRVDLLFADIGLPGMSGTDLARAAQAMRPDLKVIFASGYGETAEAAAIGGAAYLAKPYEQDQLAAVLAAMAKGPASATGKAN